MSHFKGLEALKAVLIKGTNYRKIEHSSTNKTVTDTLSESGYACSKKVAHTVFTR